MVCVVSGIRKFLPCLHLLLLLLNSVQLDHGGVAVLRGAGSDLLAKLGMYQYND